MKKLLSLCLIVVLSVSLISCGKTAKNDTFKWSNIVLNTVLPDPNTNKGHVWTNSSEELSLTIYNVSSENFDNYVSACKEKGFTEDIEYTQSNFEAKNAEGYELNLYLYGTDKDLSVSLKKPKDKTSATSDAQATEKSTEKSNTAANGVNPEFKATMDSYEEFFDEYAAFMNKYKNSSNQASLASDLSSYMTKYSEMMNNLNKIQKDSLSSADLVYYTEVMARISQKLANTSQ